MCEGITNSGMTFVARELAADSIGSNNRFGVVRVSFVGGEVNSRKTREDLYPEKEAICKARVKCFGNSSSGNELMAFKSSLDRTTLKLVLKSVAKRKSRQNSVVRGLIDHQSQKRSPSIDDCFRIGCCIPHNSGAHGACGDALEAH